MQAILSRADLNGALTLVKRSVDRRNTLPVLTGARLTAAPGGLAVIGTDLDREIRVTIPAAVDSGFDTVIPAHLLADTVKRTAGDMLAVDTEESGEHVRLDFGGPASRLATLPASDFPEFPGVDVLSGVTFYMASDVLADALRRTEFAISTEETRYYLGGVYMHAGINGLQFVATDGHRLSFVPTGLFPEGAAGLPGVIIPRATVADVLALIGKRKPPVPVRVTVALTNGFAPGYQIEFASDRVKIRSKTIDGTFPDYQRVIPSGNDKVLHVDRDALAAMVKGVAAVGSHKAAPVRFTVEADGDGPGILTVSVRDQDTGTASDCCEVQATGFGPGEFPIGFNSAYVLDALAALRGPVATFALSDPGSPALIHDGSGDGSLIVNMPMRV